MAARLFKGQAEDELGVIELGVAVFSIGIVLFGGPTERRALGDHHSQPAEVEMLADIFRIEDELALADFEFRAFGRFDRIGDLQERQVGLDLFSRRRLIGQNRQLAAGHDLDADRTLDITISQGHFGRVSAPGNDGLVGGPFQVDRRQEVGLLLPFFMPHEGGIADRESRPVRLELGVPAAGEESEFGIEDIHVVLAVLDPAVLDGLGGVSRKRPFPGRVADDNGFVLSDDRDALGLGRRRRHDCTLTAVKQQAGGVITTDQLFPALALFPELAEDEPAAFWREGEPDVADVDALMIDHPLVDGGGRSPVRPEDGAVKLDRLVEDIGYGRVFGKGVIGAQGVKIDHVVTDHGAGILRPVALGELLGHHLLLEIPGRLLPLLVFKGDAGDIEAHGMVAGDIMDSRDLIPANTRKPKEKSLFPLGA